MALVCTLLAGCVEENTPRLTAQATQPASTILPPNPGVSPSGATIAFVSLAGAPDPIRRALGDAMTSTLASERVTLAPAASAHYLIQGHLLAVPGDRYTSVAYIWDVYGADKRRRYRLEAAVVVRGVAADRWSLVTQKVIQAVAARSARGLAAYLTYTPEAAARPARAPSAGAAVASAASPRSQAPVPVPVLSFAPSR